MENPKAMTRAEIGSAMDSLLAIEGKIEGLPYRDAMDAMRSVQEVRDLIGEALPGGYYGTCMHCEEVCGEDEMQDCGDERFCTACVARWEADEKNQHEGAIAQAEAEAR